MKRQHLIGTTMRIDKHDLCALKEVGARETERTGSRVNASMIIRRLIREFLRRQKEH